LRSFVGLDIAKARHAAAIAEDGQQQRFWERLLPILGMTVIAATDRYEIFTDRAGPWDATKARLHNHVLRLSTARAVLATSIHACIEAPALLIW
jgi:hypothetical protein